MRKIKKSRTWLWMEIYLEKTLINSNKLSKEKFYSRWVPMQSTRIRNPSLPRRFWAISWSCIRSWLNISTNIQGRKEFVVDYWCFVGYLSFTDWCLVQFWSAYFRNISLINKVLNLNIRVFLKNITLKYYDEWNRKE